MLTSISYLAFRQVVLIIPSVFSRLPVPVCISELVIVIGGVGLVDNLARPRECVVERPIVFHSGLAGCSLGLLPPYGTLDTLHHRLEGGILLDAPFGDHGRVDDGGVIPAEEFPDVWEGEVHETAAE